MKRSVERLRENFESIFPLADPLTCAVRLLNYAFKMLICPSRFRTVIALKYWPDVLTSTLSGCCLITKGLWCPMFMSGSSYVTAWPTGITLGSKGPLVGVLHGRKFWTFLLCLQRKKKEDTKEVNLILNANMNIVDMSNRIFYNPSNSYLSQFFFVSAMHATWQHSTAYFSSPSPSALTKWNE